jgi:hypothetical protein
LYGLNWDDSHHLHPDERFIVLTAVTIHWSKNVSEYLDPEISSLSPYNTDDYKSYIYGTFPLFLTKAFADVLGYGTYDKLHLVGRLLSALFDIGSLLLVYFIAINIFSKSTALLSAAFYAIAVLPIQQSHFFTADNFMVFWILLTFLLLVIFLEKESYLSLWLSGFIGISFALALASKVSAGLFTTLIALAFGIKFLKSAERFGWLKSMLKLLGYFFVFMLSGYIVFRLVQPYFFATKSWVDLTPQSDFWSALDFQRKALSGEVMFPPQWQWVNTTPYIFPLKNLLLWGLGLPLGISSLLGLGLFFVSQIKKVTKDKLRGLKQIVFTPGFLAFFWIVVLFVYGGGNFVKPMRYFLPIVPFLIIFAAYTFEKNATIDTRISKTGVCLIFTLSFLWALAYVNIYSKETTRIAASKWIYQNIAETNVLANEEWDDILPLCLDDDELKKENSKYKQYKSFLIDVYNTDNSTKLEEIYKDLSRADYIILSSPRASDTIGRLPEHYPIMTKYYHYLNSGDLGFDQASEITTYPNLFGIEINDSSAEEAFWVYDHPRVSIYKKIKDISRNELKKLFPGYL